MKQVGWVAFGTSVRFDGLRYKVEKTDRATGKVVLTPVKGDSWQPVAPKTILLDTATEVEV